MSRIYLLLLFPLYSSCQFNPDSASGGIDPTLPDSLKVVQDIPLPPGFMRVPVEPASFGEWLRKIPLKKNRRVYLYNGELKRNQAAQFAVLDISVGEKDLQQCADAVMRLRAEYLFAQRRFSEIVFRDNNGKAYAWEGGNDRGGFDRYLERVFGWCGSASLEKQLRPVINDPAIRIGDVWIKGGFPGHAMIVVDVARNTKGEQIFLVAQSYMPAQDIHIVVNTGSGGNDPWYQYREGRELVTPEWIFKPGQLRRW